MKLYDYFRSSAAYRVRIALNLKGLAYERHEVHLVRDGGEHLKADYRVINPQARVPALELDSGTILTQSPAILEWIEETHPEPPLLPADPILRARVRAVAAIVACDIHPVNNLGVLKYLRGQLGHDQETVNGWYRHWIEEGFRAIESLVEGEPFCFGDRPSLADVALVPQVYNARRFNVPLDPFPKIARIDAACAALRTCSQTGRASRCWSGCYFEVNEG
jgi:maleylacetoacetate isomerase/maleylpyruvate isomerase